VDDGDGDEGQPDRDHLISLISVCSTFAVHRHVSGRAPTPVPGRCLCAPFRTALPGSVRFSMVRDLSYPCGRAFSAVQWENEVASVRFMNCKG
jgi:hypothetical protein